MKYSYSGIRQRGCTKERRDLFVENAKESIARCLKDKMYVLIRDSSLEDHERERVEVGIYAQSPEKMILILQSIQAIKDHYPGKPLLNSLLKQIETAL